METWNSLPDDLKEALAGAAKQYFDDLLKIYADELAKVDALVKAGKVIRSPIDEACDEAHEEAAMALWDEIAKRDAAAAEAIAITKEWRKTLK
jgi:TRAP-type C4-dicarboxylate transport system substrate-binding protein